MKKWFRKYYRHILVLLLCLSLACMIWAVIHGGVTGVQFLCWTVMLLAGGVIIVNNRRSQALHEAMFTLFYTAFAVELWTKDRSILLALPFVPLVLFMAWSAIDTYFKSKRSSCDADSPGEAPFELEGKSNG